MADHPGHNVFHYTDKAGWNAIRALPIWRFKVSKPEDPKRPLGVYFTDIEPTEANLRTLYKRIRVPKVKQAYVFWFVKTTGLQQLHDGTGRDRHIFFSAVDYEVVADRQRFAGGTEGLKESFQ
jgi:hypothetical protein